LAETANSSPLAVVPVIVSVAAFAQLGVHDTTGVPVRLATTTLEIPDVPVQRLRTSSVVSPS
jgi:hypothetical protein